MTKRRIAGVAVALLLLAAAPAAMAGRAQQCRRNCRDVIASECGDRLGLPRPDRICKRELLRQCKRESLDVCTFPILVGSWRFDVEVCTKTCEGKPPKDCRTTAYDTFTFLQKGTKLDETQRDLAGWLTDRANIRLEGQSLTGATATLTGTIVSTSRIANVAYEVATQFDDDGICHLSQLGELVR
jgi:hypothetical protein